MILNVSQVNQGITIARKPKYIDVDEQLWARFKSIAALNNVKMRDAAEQAISMWLKENQ